MTDKSYRDRAEAAMGDYLDALERALAADLPKASTLEAARRFFDSQGIDVNGGTSGSQQKKADYLRSTLDELKSNRKTGTDE